MVLGAIEQVTPEAEYLETNNTFNYMFKRVVMYALLTMININSIKQIIFTHDLIRKHNSALLNKLIQQTANQLYYIYLF